jgi:hypothetical protein
MIVVVDVICVLFIDIEGAYMYWIKIDKYPLEAKASSYMYIVYMYSVVRC